jgi:dipeptidyl-peptidase-4
VRVFLRDSSAITYAANLKGKLMLVYNFEDDNVLFQHTLRMMDALERAGKQFEFLFYPQESRGVNGPVNKQMLEAMTAFFENNLK